MSAAIETERREPGPAVRRRCALVECHDRHDELFPTLVHLLQQLDCDVEIFTTLRNRIRNPRANFAELDPRMHVSVTAGQVLAAVARERFDLVVINTFEGRAVLDCVAKLLLDTPVIAFVHDGRLVGDLPGYLPFLSHPHLRLMVLAPHVAQTFAPLADAGTVYPVYFATGVGEPLPRRPGRRRISAPDLFATSWAEQRRLLDTLRELTTAGHADFELCFTGSTLARPLRDFLRKTREAGLQDHVRHVVNGRGSRASQRLLQNSDYVLSLLNPDTHARCFQSESTTSLAFALGFNAIPVAHAELAAQYGLEDCAFTYTNDLGSALRRALDASDADLALARVRLAAVRRRLLAESQRNLADAVDALTARQAPLLRPPDLGPVEAMAG